MGYEKFLRMSYEKFLRIGSIYSPEIITRKSPAPAPNQTPASIRCSSQEFLEKIPISVDIFTEFLVKYSWKFLRIPGKHFYEFPQNCYLGGFHQMTIFFAQFSFRTFAHIFENGNPIWNVYIQN